MSVIVDGIKISVSDEHDEKHPSSIVLIDVGSVIFFNVVHRQNEYSPIKIMLDGIFIFFNVLHPQNDPPPLIPKPIFPPVIL